MHLPDILVFAMWIAAIVINLSEYSFNLSVIAHILLLGTVLYALLHAYKVKRGLVISVFIAIAILIGLYFFISKATPSLERYLPWVSIGLLLIVLAVFLILRPKSQY